MKQYIDKAAVVAEIRRIMAEEMSFFKDCCKDELENTSSPVIYTRMEMLISFLDTLEAKEVKEVDFEQEYDRYCENLCVIDIDEPFIEMYGCAKHFFELGMAVGNKTQKGE